MRWTVALCLLSIIGLIAIPSCGHTEDAGKGNHAGSRPNASGGSAWPFDSTQAAQRQAEAAKALGVPKELTLELGNGVTMKLTLIPAGKFMMSSPKDEMGRGEEEGPQHEVTISRPFYMGVYDVTQAQYEQVMGANPSRFKSSGNPVETVSWLEAVAFCEKLSRQTGRTVALATEAQWEFACRAGTATPFNTGATLAADQANYDATYVYGSGVKGEFRQKTTPAGSFKPNAFGMFDMHGNVWQWCADWYDKAYYAGSAAVDPKGPETGNLRVLRGGCWHVYPGDCRSAYRFGLQPEIRADRAGFRVVVDPTAAVTSKPSTQATKTTR